MTVVRLTSLLVAALVSKSCAKDDLLAAVASVAEKAVTEVSKETVEDFGKHAVAQVAGVQVRHSNTQTDVSAPTANANASSEKQVEVPTISSSEAVIRPPAGVNASVRNSTADQTLEESTPVVNVQIKQDSPNSSYKKASADITANKTVVSDTAQTVVNTETLASTQEQKLAKAVLTDANASREMQKLAEAILAGAKPAHVAATDLAHNDSSLETGNASLATTDAHADKANVTSAAQVELNATEKPLAPNATYATKNKSTEHVAALEKQVVAPTEQPVLASASTVSNATEQVVVASAVVSKSSPADKSVRALNVSAANDRTTEAHVQYVSLVEKNVSTPSNASSLSEQLSTATANKSTRVETAVVARVAEVDGIVRSNASNASVVASAVGKETTAAGRDASPHNETTILSAPVDSSSAPRAAVMTNSTSNTSTNLEAVTAMAANAEKTLSDALAPNSALRHEAQSSGSSFLPFLVIAGAAAFMLSRYYSTAFESPYMKALNAMRQEESGGARGEVEIGPYKLYNHFP